MGFPQKVKLGLCIASCHVHGQEEFKANTFSPLLTRFGVAHAIVFLAFSLTAAQWLLKSSALLHLALGYIATLLECTYLYYLDQKISYL